MRRHEATLSRSGNYLWINPGGRVTLFVLVMQLCPVVQVSKQGNKNFFMRVINRGFSRVPAHGIH